MVTNGLATGPCLISTRLLVYTWSAQTEAEGHRLAHERSLGVALRVVARHGSRWRWRGGLGVAAADSLAS